MRETKLLLSTWLLSLCLSSSGLAQNSIQIISNTASLVKYSTTTSLTPTHLFILYGDGEFGTQHSPNHYFPASGSGYTTEAYFVKAYDTNPPPKLTVNTGGVVGGPINNPTTYMTGEIDVMTSWATAFGFEHFFIIAFKNEKSQETLDGCIEFHFKNNQININQLGIKEYNLWVTNRAIGPSNQGSFDQMLKWKFSNLAPNETRFVYVPAMVFTKPGELVDVAAHYKVDCVNSDENERNLGHSGAFSFRTRTHPHDPNNKTVNKTCLQPFLPDYQRLEYTISFFNDGNGYAHDVYLFDQLDPNLDPSTIQILDYEYPPTITLTGNDLHIDFLGMMLPGTNQTFPQNYSYEDACSHITFSICAQPWLYHPTTIISNEAEIQFDNQAIFITEPAIISTTELCSTFEYCDTDRQADASDKEEINTALDPSARLKVQPNPFQNSIQVQAYFEKEASGRFSLEIVDFSGKVVRQLHQSAVGFEFFEQQFYLDDLPDGIYMMVLRTDRDVHTQKIIKL